MNALRPYIGITGFTNEDQVTYLTEVFGRHKKPGSSRLLHVGVMMSHSTLTGGQSRFTHIFPNKDYLSSEIFGNHPEYRPKDTYFCLHYADYQNITTVDDLVRAIHYCGPNLDAVQLDMTWPAPTMIDRVKDMFRGRSIEFILQIGKKAVESHHGDSVAIAKVVGLYGDSINRVLLDMSMGNGVAMDSTLLIDLIEAIEGEAPHFGIVVAGGLGPGRTHLLGKLAERPRISIDAQAGLTQGGTITDRLCLYRACRYLEEFLPILD